MQIPVNPKLVRPDHHYRELAPFIYAVKAALHDRALLGRREIGYESIRGSIGSVCLDGVYHLRPAGGYDAVRVMAHHPRRTVAHFTDYIALHDWILELP